MTHPIDEVLAGDRSRIDGVTALAQEPAELIDASAQLSTERGAAFVPST